MKFFLQKSATFCRGLTNLTGSKTFLKLFKNYFRIYLHFHTQKHAWLVLEHQIHITISTSISAEDVREVF